MTAFSPPNKALQQVNKKVSEADRRTTTAETIGNLARLVELQATMDHDPGTESRMRAVQDRQQPKIDSLQIQQADLGEKEINTIVRERVPVKQLEAQISDLKAKLAPLEAKEQSLRRSSTLEGAAVQLDLQLKMEPLSNQVKVLTEALMILQKHQH